LADGGRLGVGSQLSHQHHHRAEEPIDMNTFIPAALVGAAMTAAAIGFGAVAHASFDYADQPAGQVVNTLQTMGYTVAINGPTNNMPLSTCRVTGVSGLTDIPASTVYVDVSCPNGNSSN